MTTKSFIYIASCAICIALASCRTTLPCGTVLPCDPEDHQLSNPDGDEPVYPELAIIKLSEDMKEHVFVSPVVDHIRELEYIRVDSTNGKTYVWDAWQGGDSLIYTDTLALSNTQFEDFSYFSFAEQQLGIVGTNPYILLDNGYAIIDWKWGLFHALSGEFLKVRHWMPLAGGVYCTNPYYYNGTIANEEYYLLDLSWNELTDLNSAWQIQEGTKIDKPEMRYIKLKNIEKYNKPETGYREIQNKYRVNDINVINAYSTYSKDTEAGDTLIKDFDSLQTFYVETLNKMIIGNDFESLTSKR